MSSAMGSLRRAVGACGRAAGGGCTAAVASTGRGGAGAGAGGVVAEVGVGSATCGRTGFAKKGAGWEPDCRKTALTTMTTQAAPAPRMAKESTGRRVNLAQTRKPTEAAAPIAPAATPRRFLSRRSRTFLHPHFGTHRITLAIQRGAR